MNKLQKVLAGLIMMLLLIIVGTALLDIRYIMRGRDDGFLNPRVVIDSIHVMALLAVITLLLTGWFIYLIRHEFKTKRDET